MASRDAWVMAAFDTLMTQSVERVRVEVLAKRLKVTKGSFYWHFSSRPALLNALLEDWELRATADIITRIDSKPAPAGQRLQSLFKVIHAVAGAPGIETSIRAWAASDKLARKVVARVDARREAYVAALLENAGLSKSVAASRAHFMYLTLIGEFTWAATGGAATAMRHWHQWVELMLSRTAQ